MIDIKELSIGNWVNYRPGWKDEETGQIVYESGTGFPVKIEMMYFCQGEGLVQYNDGQNDGIEACDYELFPIEITPEILEKNGIKKEYNILYDDFYHNENMSIVKVVDEWFVRNGVTNSLYVKYVHQLQNALTLCGITKNIII